ncbi:MAG: helix-turn-helix domain-containing protein [Euryarchaeota archaeon]|nr:helix-turn-helix domain-containing protein [Euryarchaeota archaeon]
MRKAVLILNTEKLYAFFPQFLQGIFEMVEYVEGKALLKLDFEKGIKIVICDIKMKEGYTLDDLPLPKYSHLTLMEQKGDTYTCLIKAEFKNLYNEDAGFSKGYLMRFTEAFDVAEMIFDFPMYFSKEKLVYSIIADNEQIKKMLDLIEPLDIIESVSFQQPTISDYNLLSTLTPRQREVLITAKKQGYYEIPRKVNADDISEELGISKATMLEHLRKAENRIISQILLGY